jgi:hypothetical protein
MADPINPVAPVTKFFIFQYLPTGLILMIGASRQTPSIF